MSDLFSLLVTQIWQVTILAIVVWVVVRIFATDRPHLAHALWILVLLKCITPPVWSSPTSAFSWLLSPQIPVTSPRDDLVEPANINLAPNANSQFNVGVSVDLAKEFGTPVSDTNEEASNVLMESPSISRSVSSSETTATDWRSLAGMVWLVGALVGLAVVIVRFVAFLFWLRRTPNFENPKITQLVEQLAKRLSIRQKVVSKISRGSVGPAVLGLFNPCIILPESIVTGKSAEQLEPLIAHELVHIRRGDLWWAMVQAIAQSLFWFHPLVWFASRMVTRESERSCDEETIASLGCPPAKYARGLLDVLEQKHRLMVAPSIPGVRPVDITSARLERVMKLGNGSLKRTPVWVWLLMLILGAIVLPGAAMVWAQESGGEIQSGPSLPLTEDSKLGLPPVDDSYVWKLQMFEVGDLLQRLREMGLKELTPEERLLRELPRRMPGKNGKSATPLRREIQVNTKDSIVVLGHKEPSMKIIGDKLYAYDTTRILGEIEELIEHCRGLGFRKVVMETRFLNLPVSRLKELKIDWSLADSSVNEMVKVDELVHKGNSDVTYQVESGMRWASYGNHLVEVSKENESSSVRSTSYTEQSQPAFFALLSKDDIESLLQKVQGDLQGQQDMSPTVTMFNGQDAEISDGKSRPFVVGVKKVTKKEQPDAVGFQPIIRVVRDGMFFDLKVLINPSDSINLDCKLTFSDVLSVETVELPLAHENIDEQQVSIQVPEVSKQVMRANLEIPKGHMLALATFRKNKIGEKEAFIALLKSKVLFDESPPQCTNRAMSGQEALETRLAKVSDQTFLGLMERVVEIIQ